MAALCGCPLRNARAKLWPGRGPGSFRTRGGRERRHEAALFFLVSGVGLVLSSAPLWISRYVLDLETPDVSVVTQEIADFISAQIVGTLIAMIFRFWALRKWVFPDEKPSVRQRAIGSRSRLHGRGGLMTANPEAVSANGLLHAAATPHEPGLAPGRRAPQYPPKRPVAPFACSLSPWRSTFDLQVWRPMTRWLTAPRHLPAHRPRPPRL
ncbi:GtrA family protein [Streptosporangium sp. NPDC006930]|uniref:GtrA family protein n=1 Tax=unclassified Streptosporangium TaxID=2632669 RepID=UPI003442BB64